MHGSLDNRVALVTGSTRGLGKQMALALAKHGAHVAMNFNGDRETAEQAFRELQALGDDHCLLQADVTDENSIQQMHCCITDELGPVDILVLNATCDQPSQRIEDYS